MFRPYIQITTYTKNAEVLGVLSRALGINYEEGSIRMTDDGVFAEYRFYGLMEAADFADRVGKFNGVLQLGVLPVLTEEEEEEEEDESEESDAVQEVG